MDFRTFLERTASYRSFARPIDPRFDLPAAIAHDESQPLVFESVAGYPECRAVANVVSSRTSLAASLGVEPDGIIDTVSRALDHPEPVTERVGPRFEHVADDPTLDESFPIPVFYDKLDRQYLASSIVIVKDPDSGVQNLSFHRMMYNGDNELVIRIVERHLHDIRSRTDGDLDVAVVMGVHPAVEIAAATSFSPELSELALANALLDGDLELADVNGFSIPAGAELVLFGRITDRTADEGPFVDLSRTWDVIRDQPVLEVDELWTRPNPYVRIIVPGRREHAHLMGIPQEPRIYKIVENTVPTVTNVVLTPGGGSWLHGIVQLAPRTAGDPKNAGLAALAAHPSMKKVTLVDTDIDPADPNHVEWAEATRLQPDSDIVVIEGAKGSSLDPSQDFGTRTTAKWIVDATRPANADPEEFEDAEIPGEHDIDLTEYE